MRLNEGIWIYNTDYTSRLRITLKTFFYSFTCIHLYITHDNKRKWKFISVIKHFFYLIKFIFKNPQNSEG